MYLFDGQCRESQRYVSEGCHKYAPDSHNEL